MQTDPRHEVSGEMTVCVHARAHTCSCTLMASVEKGGDSNLGCLERSKTVGTYLKPTLI